MLEVVLNTLVLSTAPRILCGDFNVTAAETAHGRIVTSGTGPYRLETATLRQKTGR